jgi:hypothetical protein
MNTALLCCQWVLLNFHICKIKSDRKYALFAASLWKSYYFYGLVVAMDIHLFNNTIIKEISRNIKKYEHILVQNLNFLDIPTTAL